jgi:hypothetical protein
MTSGRSPSEHVARIEAEFQARFDLLEQSGQVTPAARRMTVATLDQLSQETGVGFTEANAAPFATHLVIAFTRLARGEFEEPSAVVADEIHDRAAERDVVDRLMRECSRELGHEIPAGEVDYMTVHLCAIVDEARGQ